jgi:hypothetical protein
MIPSPPNPRCRRRGVGGTDWPTFHRPCLHATAGRFALITEKMQVTPAGEACEQSHYFNSRAQPQSNKISSEYPAIFVSQLTPGTRRQAPENMGSPPAQSMRSHT